MELERQNFWIQMLAESFLRNPFQGFGWMALIIIGAVSLIVVSRKLAGWMTWNPLIDKKRFVIDWAKYIVWGTVQQITCALLFFFLWHFMGSFWALIIVSSVFAAIHVPNLLLVFATFALEMLLLNFYSYFGNLYLLGIVHGTVAVTLRWLTPPELNLNFRIWKL